MNKGILGLVGCLGVLVVVALILLVTLIGGYNDLVQSSASVDTAWAQVQTQYQRRADLIPNLVRTVEGAANFEKSTLTDVVNARANATKVTVDLSKARQPTRNCFSVSSRHRMHCPGRWADWPKMLQM